MPGKADVLSRNQIQFQFAAAATPKPPAPNAAVWRKPPAAQDKAILQVLDRVQAGLALDDVLLRLFDSFSHLIPYDWLGFALIKDGGETVRLRWAKSRLGRVNLKSGMSLSMSESGLAHVLETRCPQIISDLGTYCSQHPGYLFIHDRLKEGLSSAMVCPLISRGQPRGFLFFLSRLPDVYHNPHLDAFLKTAPSLMLILEKARLYQQVQEQFHGRNKYFDIAVHDLKHPLSVIQGYADILQSGKWGKAETAGMLEKITDSCLQMTALLDDFLDEEKDSGVLDIDPQAVSLPDYLSECASTLDLLCRKKDISLKRAFSDLPEKTSFDPDRIRQVLQNLVSNAVKFSEPGTMVTLKARALPGAVEISVADQGQGIPKEELPKIFKAYAKAKGVSPTAGEKSTGLGLAIARQIVNAHGGRLWVKSEPGQGSTFGFRLPAPSPSR